MAQPRLAVDGVTQNVQQSIKEGEDEDNTDIHVMVSWTTLVWTTAVQMVVLTTAVRTHTTTQRVTTAPLMVVRATMVTLMGQMEQTTAAPWTTTLSHGWQRHCR
jgi:hypothetical protein